MIRPFTLIIEDDAELAEIFSHTLEMRDFQIAVVPNPRHAIHLLIQFIPEMVLLDIHPPYALGLGILEEIRSMPHLSDTKIVVVTSSRLLGKRLEYKADMDLVNPVGIKQMSEAAYGFAYPI